MKISEIGVVLDLAVRARKNGHVFNPCFISAPGIGKTESVEQWAKSRKLRHITMTLSSYDPPDFKGFPHVERINGKQRMSFATPDFWPDDGEGVIILEEMNRAPTSIMQCLLSLGDSRRGFDGYKLPDGWIIVGCINPEDGEYETTKRDPALKDRFEDFFITYDKTAFVNFMKGAAWHKDIINFVDANLWSFSPPESIGNIPGAKYIAPRTLSKLNAILSAGFEKEHELMFYETELGANVSKDFYNFRYNESPVTYHNLLNDFPAAEKKLLRFADPDNYKTGLIELTIKDIIEDNTISNALLVKVCKVLPVEKTITLLNELAAKRKDSTLLDTIAKMDSQLKNSVSAVLKYKK